MRFCGCSYAYIVALGYITVVNKNNNNDNENRKLAFENNASFTTCLSKVNGILIDNVDLDDVMPIYNFLDYSNNQEKTTGSLWNYYRDQPKYDAVGNGNAKMAISLTDSKSFNYETKITGELNAGENRNNDIKIIVPSKHLNNFWRMLNISMINC